MLKLLLVSNHIFFDYCRELEVTDKGWLNPLSYVSIWHVRSEISILNCSKNLEKYKESGKKKKYKNTMLHNFLFKLKCEKLIK